MRVQIQGICRRQIYSLPHNKILDSSKFKAFADNKDKVLQMMIFAFERVANIVENGENAGYQHFLQNTLNVFKRLLPEGRQKSGLCGKVLNIPKMVVYCYTIENIVGQGENPGYQHFLLVLQRFQKQPFSRPLKPRVSW